MYPDISIDRADFRRAGLPSSAAFQSFGPAHAQAENKFEARGMSEAGKAAILKARPGVAMDSWMM